MVCIILAAGYATRLYPLTEHFPKPLLQIGEKTILDHLVDDLVSGGKITEFIVISNHKFLNHFQEWATSKDCKITIVDDGTETNEPRLGAVMDIRFAIDTLHLSDDALIIAGDNVLDFSLNTFIEYAEEKNTSCVMRYAEPDTKKLSKSGVLELNGDRVLQMEEKPANPKSNWCCPPFYFYKKSDLSDIHLAIEEGCGTDAPGSYAAWLCDRTAVHAMEMPGRRFDIGNLESYEKVKAEYKGINK